MEALQAGRGQPYLNRDHHQLNEWTTRTVCTIAPIPSPEPCLEDQASSQGAGTPTP